MFRVRERLCTTELDIFLSHVHLDHVVGLTFLLDILHEKQVARVTVHGETEKLAAIEQHLLAELIFPVKLPCQYKPLAGPVALPNGGRLSHFPLKHRGGSVGYRLDWPGHSMAYVTDTTASVDAAYVESIRGVDLLVHECYFNDGQAAQAETTGHSTTSHVAEVARRAAVGRLVLVHMNPQDESDDPIGLAAARSLFAATEMGEDEAVYEF
jgi:ribonuclease BN (tRNA processing enzyme)